MTDTEFNVRVNTLIMVSTLEFIFSWVTPYAWWLDGLILFGSGLLCCLAVSVKRVH